MYDPTWIQLNTLAAPTRAVAATFVATLREAGLPVIVSSARRSLEEQRRLVAEGRSLTLRSAHLEGRAFDIDFYGWRRDDVPRWLWDVVGPFGESLGLVWGGRWVNFWDPGHFELPAGRTPSTT